MNAPETSGSLAVLHYISEFQFPERKVPMYSIRRVVLLLIASIVIFVQPTVANEPAMNVLVLYADDWRHDTLGCAGNPIVKTPRLDELATEGIRFRRNYVTTSICGVSRATLLTGQWMSRHGNRAFERFRTPWEETYPGILRARGYHVGHIGKWHNGKFPSDQFDVGLPYADTHWHKEPDGSQIHVTKKNERDALGFLRNRPQDKPFCLTLSFFATHAEDANPKQFLPQPESFSLYADQSIPFPATGDESHYRKLPDFIAQEKNEGRIRWKWRFDTPERYQEFMKNYYRLATEVDTTCGVVLDELKSLGLLDRTLVIFTTDNGYFHGEHGLADKWYPYEESIRVPLIVRDPRMNPSRRGTTSDEMTLNVDLAPTILGAVGARSPSGMQGRSLLPLLRDESLPQDWRQEYYYEHGTISNIHRIPSSEALVRKDRKYIVWPDFGFEEYFDLTRDPGETLNLIRDPQYQSDIEQAKQSFAKLKQKSQ
jgi:arylsulfatase